jgi:hypothetical protein
VLATVISDVRTAAGNDCLFVSNLDIRLH